MYNGRTIREAMKEAHENVDNYGGTWFVCSDEFKSVVKESYFITDEGDRKVKPFVCLYNTNDMKYGFHKVQWVNGEIVIDTDDRLEERFFQPYDTKFVEETVVHKKRSIGVSTTSPITIGDPHVGTSIALAKSLEIARMHDRLKDTMSLPTGNLIEKSKERGIDIKNTSKPFIINNPYEGMKNWFDEPYVEPKVFDMATGKMKPLPVSGSISEEKRKALRKKRKKRRK